MAKKKLTKEQVDEAIQNGEPICPGCQAEWTAPLDDKGKPMKNPPNLVLIHTRKCPAYLEPKEAK